MPPSACCPPDFSGLFARQIMQHARLHFSPIKSFETMKTRFPSRFCNSSMSKIINSMQLFLDSKRFHVTSWKKIQSQYLYTSLYFFNFARPLFCIEVEDYDKKEVLLHNVFSGCRVGVTELFAVDADRVVALMSALLYSVFYPFRSSTFAYHLTLLNSNTSSSAYSRRLLSCASVTILSSIWYLYSSS